jgi:hypothetical protein
MSAISVSGVCMKSPIEIKIIEKSRYGTISRRKISPVSHTASAPRSMSFIFSPFCTPDFKQFQDSFFPTINL